MSSREHNEVVNTLEKIFLCDMTSLPLEVPLHSFTWNFIDHNQNLLGLKTCLSKRNAKMNTEQCRKIHLKLVCPSKFGLNLQVSNLHCLANFINIVHIHVLCALSCGCIMLWILL